MDKFSVTVKRTLVLSTTVTVDAVNESEALKLATGEARKGWQWREESDSTVACPVELVVAEEEISIGA